MPEPLLYLKAMGAAAIVSAMFVLALFSLRILAGRRTQSSAAWLNSACAVGLGLGLVAGYHVLSLQLAWPPIGGLDRLLTIVVPVALGIELIAGIRSLPRAVAWLLRMSLAVTIPRILLQGSVYLSGEGDWTRWQALMAMAGCGALLAGVWCLLAWLFRRSEGVSISFALCLTIQCAGVTVMMAGYIKGGAAALPLVATLMATTSVAWLLWKRSAVPIAVGTAAIPGTPASMDASAIIGIGMVGLFGLLFIGRFFGRISSTCALIMLLAPLLCWATETPRLRHRKPWLVGSLRLLLVAIPLVAVLAAAKRDFDRDMSPLIGKSNEESTFP